MKELFDNLEGRLVPRDVCARKHGGNTQSNEAFVQIRSLLSKKQSRLFAIIACCWPGGCTVDELSEYEQTTPNAISGRITELRMKGKIKQNGTRKTRSGCSAAVWIVAE